VTRYFSIVDLLFLRGELGSDIQETGSQFTRQSKIDGILAAVHRGGMAGIRAVLVERKDPSRKPAVQPGNDNGDGAMMTVRQVADKIGVSDSLVYEWCSAGLLTHYRFGSKGRRGKIMIDEAELDAFLSSCRQEARPEVPPLKHIKLNHG
jgi:excisionase family DNA binding protein